MNALLPMWTIAWRDLARNRRRSLLSLVAVTLGLALILTLNGMVIGVVHDTIDNAIRLETGHLQIRSATYEPARLSLDPGDLVREPQSLVARAQSVHGVIAASPVLWLAGIATTAGEEALPIRVFGLDPESAVHAAWRESLATGEFLSADDRSAVLVGRALAKELGLLPGDKLNVAVVNAEGDSVGGDFNVRGLFDTGVPSFDQTVVLMPLAKAQALAGSRDRASAVVVLLERADDADRVAAALQGPGLVTKTWQELNEFLTTGISSFSSLYALLYGIVMLVVATVIANTLLMSAFERVREIGILGAIGARRRHVLAVFLLEAGALAGLGLLAGILVGSLGIAALASHGLYIGGAAAAVKGMALGTSMRAAFAPRSIVWLSGWMLAVILAASLYPAWFAARREPAEALRQE